MSRSGKSRTRKRSSVQRGNSLEASYRRIRELIVRGRLAPGSRLVEADLVARLGVSRTPIRGALNWLQREGYIVTLSAHDQKTRLAVAPLTKDDARELYWIVGHVEGLAARLTAQLELSARAQLIEKLRRFNESLRELAEARRHDPDRIFDLDMNFHRTIVEASAGPRLLALHNAIKPQAERYWRLYASAILDQLRISVGEHEQIIKALEDGDGPAAEQGVRMNWQNGAERLCLVIDALGERGSW